MNAIKSINFSQEEINWDNEANTQLFYNNELIESILRSFSERGGLSTGCDITKISEYLAGTKSLLEVGAGYGRVIESLLKNNYEGEIHAVENSTFFQSLLLKRFDHFLHLHRESILNFNSSKKFDVILAMWSGISDFLPEEQQQFMNKLSSLVNINGTICIDTVIWDQKPLNAELAHNQYYIIKAEDAYLRGYIPTCNEMRAYARNAGLSQFMVFNYMTDTQRERLMYILKK